MNQNVTVRSGIGIGGIGFLLLFALKISGATDMHWLMVLTSALWLPIVCFLVAAGLMATIGFAVFCVAWIAEKFGY